MIDAPVDHWIIPPRCPPFWLVFVQGRKQREVILGALVAIQALLLYAMHVFHIGIVIRIPDTIGSADRYPVIICEVDGIRMALMCGYAQRYSSII